MAGISIFAKRHSYTRDGRLVRATSIIRAEQIAPRIGARLNPDSGYEDDICIYVKPHFRNPSEFNFEGRPHLDLIDTYSFVKLAQYYPDVAVIACSEVDASTLSKVLKNPIVVIPQHHCNFERIKRTRSSVDTVGVVANPTAMKFLPEGLEDELARIGLKFKPYSNFRDREDVVRYYQTIDLQIIWRPWPAELSNPLKMANAASFGIPSIALDEPSFQEFSGCYIPVKTVDEFLREVKKLTISEEEYANLSQKCVERAEAYHVENIAKRYRQLGKQSKPLT